LFLEILAIVLLILLGLVAAVLLVPFYVTVEASKAEALTTSRVVLRWLGIAVWRSKPGKRKERAKKKSNRFELSRVPLMLSLLRDAFPSLVGVLKGLQRAVRFRRLSIDVAFGIGDPAETAVLAGYLWSVAWAFERLPHSSLSLRPDLERARLDGTVSAELRVRMLPIVAAFLIAYTKKPFRRFIGEVRR
jgi:Protein of unknown function (DUF2953)